MHPGFIGVTQVKSEQKGYSEQRERSGKVQRDKIAQYAYKPSVIK